MEKNTETLIKIESLTKTYGTKTKTCALDDISLEIKKGELTVILGSSGSGKSTLLNMIGGIDKPDRGTILFNGTDITKAKDKYLTEYRKNDVGFIFQAFSLINDITVYENIMLQANLLPSHKDPMEILKMVGLEDKKDSYPSELSGGQQQRVAIARAIIKPSSFLLLDEPTGALDYETGKKILSLVEDLVRDEGLTAILVTHTKEIAKMADHVIKMRSGKITDEYRNDIVIKSSEIEW